MRTNIQQEWTSIGRLVDALPAFSDHDHHQPDAFFREPMTLDRLFSNSYVAWTGYAPDGSDASRRALLDNARFNSYFTWLERGIQTVHGIQEPIRLDNWESVSATVKAAYAADPHFHWQVLRRHGYERLLLDTYWSGIGGDNGHPEIFTPVFRIDKFMYGTHAEAVAPNDIVPWKVYGFSGSSLDDYVDRMNAVITEQQGAGRVAALKCAEAYNRSIDFLPDDRAAAESAFGKHPDDLTDRQKNLFSNYIFNRACELAARLEIPFQIHTGLARLSGSEPMRFEPLLIRHPKTRFVLFHSGYPWIHQVAGLVHNYANVCPSLTWTATIATSAAVRALHEYIDVARSIRTLTWGSDCWHAEDSIGALLAWRWIVTTVLTERLCDGRLVAQDVEPLAQNLMFANGRHVYGGQ